MHPLTYQVMKSIPLLEFEQFRHVDDRERLNEIRALAEEQVQDDNSVSKQETYWGGGKTRMVQRPGTLEETDDEFGMWPRRTRRDLELEAGFGPLLDSALSAEQRSLVRLRYDAKETLQEIADRLGTSRQAVEQRFKVIHAKLRGALLLAYGPREEVEDDAADA